MMSCIKLLGWTLLCASVFATAIPKPDDKRILDHDLSHAQHFKDDTHNAQYDHEAFLGEEAKTFDELPPEESRRRLGYAFIILCVCLIK